MMAEHFLARDIEAIILIKNSEHQEQLHHGYAYRGDIFIENPI